MTYITTLMIFPFTAVRDNRNKCLDLRKMKKKMSLFTKILLNGILNLIIIFSNQYTLLDHVAGVANTLGRTHRLASVTMDAGMTISTDPSSKS